MAKKKVEKSTGLKWRNIMNPIARIHGDKWPDETWESWRFGIIGQYLLDDPPSVARARLWLLSQDTDLRPTRWVLQRRIEKWTKASTEKASAHRKPSNTEQSDGTSSAIASQSPNMTTSILKPERPGDIKDPVVCPEQQSASSFQPASTPSPSLDLTRAVDSVEQPLKPDGGDLMFPGASVEPEDTSDHVVAITRDNEPHCPVSEAHDFGVPRSNRTKIRRISPAGPPSRKRQRRNGQNFDLHNDTPFATNPENPMMIHHDIGQHSENETPTFENSKPSAPKHGSSLPDLAIFSSDVDRIASSLDLVGVSYRLDLLSQSLSLRDKTPVFRAYDLQNIYTSADILFGCQMVQESFILYALLCYFNWRGPFGETEVFLKCARAAIRSTDLEMSVRLLRENLSRTASSPSNRMEEFLTRLALSVNLARLENITEGVKYFTYAKAALPPSHRYCPIRDRKALFVEIYFISEAYRWHHDPYHALPVDIAFVSQHQAQPPRGQNIALIPSSSKDTARSPEQQMHSWACTALTDRVTSQIQSESLGPESGTGGAFKDLCRWLLDAMERWKYRDSQQFERFVDISNFTIVKRSSTLVQQLRINIYLAAHDHRRPEIDHICSSLAADLGITSEDLLTTLSSLLTEDPMFDSSVLDTDDSSTPCLSESAAMKFLTNNVGLLLRLPERDLKDKILSSTYRIFSFGKHLWDTTLNDELQLQLRKILIKSHALSKVMPSLPDGVAELPCEPILKTPGSSDQPSIPLTGDSLSPRMPPLRTIGGEDSYEMTTQPDESVSPRSPPYQSTPPRRRRSISMVSSVSSASLQSFKRLANSIRSRSPFRMKSRDYSEALDLDYHLPKAQMYRPASIYHLSQNAEIMGPLYSAAFAPRLEFSSGSTSERLEAAFSGLELEDKHD